MSERQQGQGREGEGKRTGKVQLAIKASGQAKLVFSAFMTSRQANVFSAFKASGWANIIRVQSKQTGKVKASRANYLLLVFKARV